jgi:TetR/AcrR family transcriptional regulator
MKTVEPQSRQANGKTRIQALNESRIITAAETVFAEHGFRGATVDEIAKRAEMSKPNLLYYFKNKKTLYRAVLDHTLNFWLEPLAELDADKDPESEIRRYIAHKLEASWKNPRASRIFASEMLRGAPVLNSYLRGDLKSLVADKCAVIEQWIAAGKLAPIDPIHLIFMIWATTQHYADFDIQVKAVWGKGALNKKEFDRIEDAVSAVILHGILPRKH